MPCVSGPYNGLRCILSANFLALADFVLQVKLGKVNQQSPWQPFRWQVLALYPVGVHVDLANGEHVQAVRVQVFQDELQGYFLNIDNAQPYVFFLVRYPEENKSLCPSVEQSTLSYDEAARWMDSNEEVQTLPMPEAIQIWLSEFVAERYKPEPKKRRRPQSFVEPAKRHIESSE